MTIKELYKWALEHCVEDYQLHIYCMEDNVETNENADKLCEIDNNNYDDATNPTFNNLEIGEYWAHGKVDHPAVWINIAPHIEYTGAEPDDE